MGSLCQTSDSVPPVHLLLLLLCAVCCMLRTSFFILDIHNALGLDCAGGKKGPSDAQSVLGISREGRRGGGGSG